MLQKKCEFLLRGESCENEPFCMYCKKNHNPIENKECLEFKKQKTNKNIKATRAVSYVDVKDEFEYFSQNKFELLDMNIDNSKVYENFAKIKGQTKLALASIGS